MRDINKIIIHCSDSNNLLHDNIDAIDDMHRANGWAGIGYHYFIDRQNAGIHIGRSIAKVGAHTFGENRKSIGICMSGRNGFTVKQMLALAKLCNNLLSIFNLSREDIYPHNKFNEKKTCPNFDIEILKNLM